MLLLHSLYINGPNKWKKGIRSNYQSKFSLSPGTIALTEAVCCWVAAAANLATWFMIGEKLVGP